MPSENGGSNGDPHTTREKSKKQPANNDTDATSETFVASMPLFQIKVETNGTEPGTLLYEKYTMLDILF